MANCQDCWDSLIKLGELGSDDPREAAGKIVRDFKAHASRGDFRHIEQRVEDALLVGRNTDVAPVYVVQHSRWLAVLEGACAAARTDAALT